MGDFNNSRSLGGRKRSSEDDDPNGKKKKNREAAQRCREKKQQETNKLKEQNAELMEQNKKLNEKKMELEQTLQSCLHEIQKHQLSGCHLPEAVREVMNSVELIPDFIPVGTQISHNSGGSFQDPEQLNETKPTVTGLFSGDQLPADSGNRQQNINPSSRSPSRSPSLSTGSPPQSRSSASLEKSNVPNNNAAQSWKHLHQQSMMDQLSPGLSPAQTVPNIDADSYAVPQTNGFPSIDEAVKNAQKSTGVTEDVSFSNISTSSLIAPMFSAQESSTPSLGFNPTSTHDNSYVSIQNNQNSMEPVTSGMQIFQSSEMINKSSSVTMNPIASSSTVSMNYTAELLSQAMNSNFDPLEIEMSEDLKKQFVRLSSSDTSDSQQDSTSSFSYGGYSVEQNTDQSNLCPSMINNVETLNSSAGDNSDNSYQDLLELAKNQQQITVQFRGKDYSCSYEQLVDLVNHMRNKKRLEALVDNSSSTPGDFFSNSNAAQAIYDQSQPLYVVSDPNLVIDPNMFYTVDTSQNQVFTFSNPENGNSYNQNYVDLQAAEISVESNEVAETSIQNTQLPTTVLSMIDGGENGNVTGSDSNIDSIDYSQNVQDLPSLSLTEDHTNIFEKRRKPS